MAAIGVKIDFSRFKQEFEQILAVIKDKDSTLRPVAVELTGLMATRIHEDGKASDGSPIGQYASSYLKTRAKYKHSETDTNVILVLTRKLFNSWGPFATDSGWAVGFVDDTAVDGVTSRKKIEYAETHFNKKILDPTEQEELYLKERLIEIINDLLSPYASA